MPSKEVQTLVNQKFLTKMQGQKLPTNYALKIGTANRRKGHKPKPSLSPRSWERRKKKNRRRPTE